MAERVPATPAAGRVGQVSRVGRAAAVVGLVLAAALWFGPVRAATEPAALAGALTSSVGDATVTSVPTGLLHARTIDNPNLPSSRTPETRRDAGRTGPGPSAGTSVDAPAGSLVIPTTRLGPAPSNTSADPVERTGNGTTGPGVDTVGAGDRSGDPDAGVPPDAPSVNQQIVVVVPSGPTTTTTSLPTTSTTTVGPSSTTSTSSTVPEVDPPEAVGDPDPADPIGPAGPAGPGPGSAGPTTGSGILPATGAGAFALRAGVVGLVLIDLGWVLVAAARRRQRVNRALAG